MNLPLRSTFLCVFISVLLTCCCLLENSDRGSSTDVASIVRAKNSTREQFHSALNKLSRDEATLLAVMNDVSYAPDRRRACLHKYFSENLTPPIEFQHLVQFLRSAKWFDPGNLELIQYVSGWLPMLPKTGSHIFVIHVLPLNGGEYFLDIYFRLPEELDFHRVQEILKGKAMKAEERTVQINDLVLWDSEDTKEHFRSGAQGQEQPTRLRGK